MEGSPGTSPQYMETIFLNTNLREKNLRIFPNTIEFKDAFITPIISGERIKKCWWWRNLMNLSASSIGTKTTKSIATKMKCWRSQKITMWRKIVCFSSSSNFLSSVPSVKLDVCRIGLGQKRVPSGISCRMSSTSISKKSRNKSRLKECLRN